MKRMPLLLTVLAVIALSASLAYWALQLYKPPQRPFTVPPPQPLPEPMPDAAATLFGGQIVTAVASNYQLTGVVASGREGVAILVADGQPPKAVRVGREISPGVSLAEVHPRYVMLSEGGVLKRIELATDTTAGPDLAAAGAVPPGAPPMMQPQMQPPPMPPQPMPQPQGMPAPMAQPSGGQSPEPVPDPPPVEAPQEGVPPPPQALPPGVTPSPPGIRMPMPNRNFIPNPPSSQ